MYICQATRATCLGHAFYVRSVRLETTLQHCCADDFITNHYPGATADLVKAYGLSGNHNCLLCVDGPEISKYGVVVPDPEGTGIIGLVEKPNIDCAPSNLASVGRYVLTPDIFDLLRKVNPGSAGEIQLADAINIQANLGAVDIVRLKGNRFDCGSVTGFIDATNFEFKRMKSSL